MEKKYKLSKFPFPKGTKWEECHPKGKYAHENFPESKYAIDYKADIGTPVLAAKGGEVIKMKKSGKHIDLKDVKDLPLSEVIKLAQENTNFVAIEHGDGTYTEYIHLDKVAVKEGDKVKPGDRLGEVGLTGVTSAPHLHLNVVKIKNKKAKSIPFRFKE